jgi:hypothetical protein
MFIRWLLVVLLTLLGAAPAWALPVTTTAASVTAANSTSVTGNVAATSTTITFTQPVTQFTINIGGSTPAIVYLSLTSPATTSNFAINPTTGTGGSYTYSGTAVSAIYIIGATAAGTYSVLGH